jgi:hypothetical protein
VFPEPSLAGKKWSDSPQMVILSSENLLIFFFGKNIRWLQVSNPLKMTFPTE